MVVASRRKTGSIGTGKAGIDIAPSDIRRANRPRCTDRLNAQGKRRHHKLDPPRQLLVESRCGAVVVG